MAKYTLVCLLLVALLLPACQPAEEGQQPDASGATEPTAIAPVAALPPIVATNTAEATETFIPIVQAEPSATPSPPPTETPTITPTPLPEPAGSINLEPVIAGGLTRPLYITHAYDDRLFVVEQPGTIRIIQNGDLLPAPFLDIRDRVGSVSNEQGLLSVAFHPNYHKEGEPGYGKFYVDYTDYNGHSVISQFSVSADDPSFADKTSEIVVLRQVQPYPNHNGGLMKFGPDGYLYIAFGDGGSAGDPQNNGQELSTYLGKLLRIDVSAGDGAYQIPAGNPFVDEPGVKEEIWAYGLRNPWRFSFDRLTGDLWLADVGQNTYEELNFTPAGSAGGENYGWRIMEASHCFLEPNCATAGLVLPIFEYDHEQGCSITGGYVYRGQAYPELAGNYFAADYCMGTIYRVAPTADGGWDTTMILDSELVIPSFGEGADGELYVTDFAQGAIYRITPGS